METETNSELHKVDLCIINHNWQLYISINLTFNPYLYVIDLWQDELFHATNSIFHCTNVQQNLISQPKLLVSPYVSGGTRYLVLLSFYRSLILNFFMIKSLTENSLTIRKLTIHFAERTTKSNDHWRIISTIANYIFAQTTSFCKFACL